MIKNMTVDDFKALHKKYCKIIDSTGRYYDLYDIMVTNSDYNLVVSGRSDGKTHNFLAWGLIFAWELGITFAYIRRWDSDIKGYSAQQIFEGINNTSLIKKITKGEYTRVQYYNKKFYWSKIDEKTEKIVRGEIPIGYTFALNQVEHTKGGSYPDCKWLIFDEFIPYGRYLENEFGLFQNTCSTIVRYNKDVQINLLANTIDSYSLYFEEFNILNNLEDLELGEIRVFNDGKKDHAQVAIERSDSKSRKKSSSKLFNFGKSNTTGNMIVNGEWEYKMFPHAPCKFDKEDILFIFFIKFNGYIFQCEIVLKDGNDFMYIHKKTTPIWDEEKELIFQVEYDYRKNYRRNLMNPIDNISKKIIKYFKDDNVYYQSNAIGSQIENFIERTKYL